MTTLTPREQRACAHIATQYAETLADVTRVRIKDGIVQSRVGSKWQVVGPVAMVHDAALKAAIAGVLNQLPNGGAK